MKRILSLLLVVLLLLPAAAASADGAKLKPGLYTSDDNWLYLYEDGFGALACNRGPEAILHGILWTENRLQIEGEEVKFSFNKNKLSFTYDGVPFETTCLDLRYVFKCGFPVRAGYYASDDGERLILALDGRGLYVDGDGPRAIWWGWQCPFGKDRSQYYILFDSALSEMVFADETLSFQNGAGKQIEMSRTGKLGSIGMDVIDEKQDFQFHMPVTGWETNNVKHTQVVAAPKAKGGVDKFLFMSAKASKTGPEAEIAYADAALKKALADMDIAYDPAAAQWQSHPVGHIVGQKATVACPKGESSIYLDCVVWTANKRQYLVAGFSADDAHRQSQDILDATLLTFETNASAAQKGTLYYLYAINGTPLKELLALNYDPHYYAVVLRPNKSCDLQLGNTFFPLTWKKPYLTDGKVNVPFYAVGDHYVLTLDYQYEFAPAAEVEALLETIR